MKTADIRKLWQMESLGAMPPSLEAVQDRAAAFHRQIGRRNRIEYIAAIVVVAAFAFYAWSESNPIVRIGHLFIVAAAGYVVWQLRRRASAERPPVAPTLPEAIDYLRGEFARQREALAHVWDWYLLPFVPGFVLIMVGPAVLPDDSGPGPGPVFGLVALAIIVLVFYAIWRANLAAARKLQQAVDELDAMREELE